MLHKFFVGMTLNNTGTSVAGDGSEETKTKHEVPPFTWCPYIEAGYRPIPCSPVYCLKSVFFVNNETFNFWTHFVPLILMLRRLYHEVSEMEDPYDSVHYGFYIHTFGVCFVLLVSSLAHMFSSVSEWVFRLCFSFDYTAIFLFGVSSQIAFERYICPIRCFGIHPHLTSDHYMWLVYVVCPLQVFAMCTSQNPKYNNCFALLRDLPMAVGYVIIIAPCVVRFVLDDMVADLSDNNCFELASSSSFLVFLQFALIFVACVVFLFRIPEKYNPGYFDVVGHSHQIFHILVALGMYVQNVLVESVIDEATEKIRQGVLSPDYLQINWNDTVRHYAFVFCVANLITFLYSFFVIRRHCCPKKKSS